jgi:hypothetical protein
MKKTTRKTKRDWPAIQATDAKARDAKNLAIKIAKHLQGYINSAVEGDGDWGTHGTVADVRHRMREIASFLQIPGVDSPVAEGHGCPRCGERQSDSLEIADDDSNQVTCLACGNTYRLP